MYTEQELKRVMELFEGIEKNKSHENAAPTYKDSPALQEIAQIMLKNDEKTEDVLSEKIIALWFLAKCYDEMCRSGMSVKYHKMLLSSHAQLMELKEYSEDDIMHLEDAFYRAVKARNQYVSDECDDLIEIMQGKMPDEKISELVKSAKESRKGLPKYDPIELTDEYLAVIDEVEEKIKKNIQFGICHEYWNLKAEYLLKHGIIWRSPAIMNPRIMFD